MSFPLFQIKWRCFLAGATAGVVAKLCGHQSGFHDQSILPQNVYMFLAQIHIAYVRYIEYY